MNAARYASRLARHTGAVIVLFHVYEVPQPAMDVPMLPYELEDIRKSHQEKLDALTAQMQYEFPSVNFHSCIMGDSVMMTDTIAHGIVEAVSTFSPDLVIMGTNSPHRNGSFFGRSHVVPVIRETNVPVLIIPQHVTYHGICNIILSFDLTYSAEKSKIDILFQLADPEKAVITLVTVADDEEPVTIKQAVSALQMEYELRNMSYKRHFIYSDRIRETIEEYVAGEKADLLVMIHHKRGILERIFNPSSTEHMAYHTDVPLLVLQG